MDLPMDGGSWSFCLKSPKGGLLRALLSGGFVILASLILAMVFQLSHSHPAYAFEVSVGSSLKMGDGLLPNLPRALLNSPSPTTLELNNSTIALRTPLQGEYEKGSDQEIPSSLWGVVNSTLPIKVAPAESPLLALADSSVPPKLIPSQEAGGGPSIAPSHAAKDSLPVSIFLGEDRNSTFSIPNLSQMGGFNRGGGEPSLPQIPLSPQSSGGGVVPGGQLILYAFCMLLGCLLTLWIVAQKERLIQLSRYHSMELRVLSERPG